MESVEIAHLVDFKSYFAAELEQLKSFVEGGLVEIEGGYITVTPKGRFFLRGITMIFDRYLQAERARTALDRLGLASRRDAPVRTLSQGQRRRGALARLALDEGPSAWILDEPYDALDQDSVQLLSRLIEGHAARGGAVLLTSHQAVALGGATEFDLEPWRVT